MRSNVVRRTSALRETARRATLAGAVALMSLVFSLTALVGCSQKSVSEEYSLVAEGQLSIAISLDYAPFASQSDGEPAGYCVAVAQELASRLGLACTFCDTTHDEVYASVINGSCDVALSLNDAGDFPEGQIDFTDTFCLVDQAVVVRSGTYATLDALAEKRIAYVAGTAGEQYAKECTGARAIAYDTAARSLDALEAGSVAGVILDWPVASASLSQGYTKCQIVERIAQGKQLSFAVGMQNTELKEALNQVLQAMTDDGTLERLQQEYW